MLKSISASGHKKVVASSGGNAGYSLAYIGKKIGVAVELIVPKTTSTYMIEKIKLLDAEVAVFGENWDEANAYATSLSNEKGLPYIPPFDHPLLWQGHSTMIDECALQMQQPSKIVVAVGGGGLLCGIFEGLKRNHWDGVKVIAAETEGAASFAASFKAQRVVELKEINTIATSLAAKRVTQQSIDYAKRFAVEPYVTNDKEAFTACKFFFEEFHTLVEPACGAALSYVANNELESNENILVIVCGGVNMGPAKYLEYQKMYALN